MPIWANVSNSLLIKLRVVELKVLRTIFNTTRQRTSNDAVYELADIKPLLHRVYEITNRLFKFDKLRTELTANIGEYGDECPSGTHKYKYKIINKVIIDNDPNT